jgi:hypothetical protein
MRVYRTLLNALLHDDLYGRLEALAEENPVVQHAPSGNVHHTAALLKLVEIGSALRTGSGKCLEGLQVYLSIPRTGALSNSIQQLANCCFKLAFEHEQKSVKSRDESSEA